MRHPKCANNKWKNEVSKFECCCSQVCIAIVCYAASKILGPSMHGIYVESHTNFLKELY